MTKEQARLLILNQCNNLQDKEINMLIDVFDVLGIINFEKNTTYTVCMTKKQFDVWNKIKDI